MVNFGTVQSRFTKVDWRTAGNNALIMTATAVAAAAGTLLCTAGRSVGTSSRKSPAVASNGDKTVPTDIEAVAIDIATGVRTRLATYSACSPVKNNQSGCNTADMSA